MSLNLNLENMPLSDMNDRLFGDIICHMQEHPDVVNGILEQSKKLRKRLNEHNVELYSLYGALPSECKEDMERYEEFTKVIDRVDMAFEVLDDSDELTLTDDQRVIGTFRILQPVVTALNYIQTSYGEFNTRRGEQLVIEATRLQCFVHTLNQRNYEVQEYFMRSFLQSD